MAELRFPLKNDTSRKIIHIDMDAFFASVEERDNPELAKHPLVIARHPSDTGGRGVVTTANYKARQYGIHSAMSAQKAFELCPHAVFIPGNHQKYREISQQVREIFGRYTDVIEPVSIDEAYLDVTVNKINCPSAIKIARMIQQDIWQTTQLTCSAGVSYNKFLAKLSSDFHKPRGLTVVMPEDAVVFLKKLPIAGEPTSKIAVPPLLAVTKRVALKKSAVPLKPGMVSFPPVPASRCEKESVSNT